MPPPRGKAGSQGPQASAMPSRCCFRRKRFCRFTVAGVGEIDYKGHRRPARFVGENGKIAGPPDRRTAFFQRRLTTPSSVPASWPAALATNTQGPEELHAMQVILLEKVKLGNLGDVVKVGTATRATS